MRKEDQLLIAACFLFGLAESVGGSLAFLDGVDGDVWRENQLDGANDVEGRESLVLLVLAERAGLISYSVEKVSDEGVHDFHSILGDADFRVDVLEDAVNVGTETFIT